MIAPLLHNLFSVSLSLIGITFIVVFHEFGHFLFCKLFNVYTPTFSIGIGKVLFSKKIGHTDFCLSAGPIGGYVEIASEKGIDGTKGFNEIPYYQKVLIMLGGIANNFLLTYIIFSLLFFIGIPESGSLPYEVNKPIIESIASDSINAHLLQPQDIIISFNNLAINNDARNIRNEIANLEKQFGLESEKQAITTVLRNGQEIQLLVNIAPTKGPEPLQKKLGFTLERKASLSLLESCKEGYKTTIFCLKAIINSLKQIFTSKESNFVGPLMAVAISSKSAQKGIKHLLFLLAIISINLGFMNLLPLPIFDGGQFVIFTIEAILQRQLSEKIRDWIGIGSWVLALGLLLIFTLKDLYTLFFQ